DYHRRTGSEVEPRDGTDEGHKVARVEELHTRPRLDVEGDDEGSRRRRSAVGDAGVEIIVLTELGFLMREAAVVGVAHPQVRRLPEHAAAERFGARVAGVVAQVQVRRRVAMQQAAGVEAV